MVFDWAHYKLHFNFDAKTSRGSMTAKDTWFIRVYDKLTHSYSIGEASFFDGLSAESREEFERELERVCASGDHAIHVSAVRFGIETALQNHQPPVDNAFTRGETGIPINGLIWMGDKTLMRSRIDQKLEDGFKVLKLKIGGIDFAEEVELLKYIRSRYSPDNLEIRLDANGSFRFDGGEALEKLKTLSDFCIHSIEQPIPPGHPEEMAMLCAETPVAIALDEELIGIRPFHDKVELVRAIKPHYLILKPSLCGGLSGADEWIEVAGTHDIGWWATSALESNIGLQGLAIWLSNHSIDMRQGLGTGLLYSNNVPSHLEIRGEYLFYNPDKSLDVPDLLWHR